MSDGFIDDHKRHALMDHEKRVVKGGKRPAPQMALAPGVRWFSEAANNTTAPGITTHVLLRTPEDPTVEIFRTDLGEGTKTSPQRAQADQRILVEAWASPILEAARRPLSHADMAAAARHFVRLCRRPAFGAGALVGDDSDARSADDLERGCLHRAASRRVLRRRRHARSRARQLA